MGNFCGKCGSKNTDDAKFCGSCGAMLGENPITEKVPLVAECDNGRKRKVGIIVGVTITAMVIIAICAVWVGNRGRSYKETVDQMVVNLFNDWCDTEALFELIPDEVIDYMLEQEGYDNLEQFIDDEEMQSERDNIEEKLGGVSYEILNVTNVDKKHLNILKGNYKDMECKISAAKVVEIEVKDEDTNESIVVNTCVIKVGWDWYVDIINTGDFFITRQIRNKDI